MTENKKKGIKKGIKKGMTKADKILLLVFLVLSLLLYGVIRFHYCTPSVEKQVIIVKVGDKIVKRIPLQDGSPLQKFTIDGKIGQAVIEIKNQEVRMLEAPCPDHICIKQGWIKRPGQSIICVPNEVVIYIDAEAPVDAVTQ